MFVAVAEKMPMKDDELMILRTMFHISKGKMIWYDLFMM